MKPLHISKAMVITQKELLLDILEAGSAIEEEFGSTLKPYTEGWYKRSDTEPTLADLGRNGKPTLYHMKGGIQIAPWDEQITLITDPNLADRSIYDMDGNKVVNVRLNVVKPKKTLFPPSLFFTRKPTLPLRGLEVIYKYVNWILDRSVRWVEQQTPLSYALKDLIQPSKVTEFEVVEVIHEAGDTHPLNTQLPEVLRSNMLIDLLIDRLEHYCGELRLTLDAFVGYDDWQMYSVTQKAHIHLHLQKLGDYRILEWTRLKQEGKI